MTAEKIIKGKMISCFCFGTLYALSTLYAIFFYFEDTFSYNFFLFVLLFPILVPLFFLWFPAILHFRAGYKIRKAMQKGINAHMVNDQLAFALLGKCLLLAFVGIDMYIYESEEGFFSFHSGLLIGCGVLTLLSILIELIFVRKTLKKLLPPPVPEEAKKSVAAPALPQGEPSAEPTEFVPTKQQKRIAIANIIFSLLCIATSIYFFNYEIDVIFEAIGFLDSLVYILLLLSILPGVLCLSFLFCWWSTIELLRRKPKPIKTAYFKMKPVSRQRRIKTALRQSMIAKLLILLFAAFHCYLHSKFENQIFYIVCIALSALFLLFELPYCYKTIKKISNDPTT